LCSMLDRGLDVPVVVVSAYADHEAQPGAPRAVSKPVDVDLLCRHVEAITSAPSARDAARVSLRTLLVVSAWEHRSCELVVRPRCEGAPAWTGELLLERGKVVGAKARGDRANDEATPFSIAGVDAALDLMLAEAVTVEIRPAGRISFPPSATVDLPLPNLLARARARGRAQLLGLETAFWAPPSSRRPVVAESGTMRAKAPTEVLDELMAFEGALGACVVDRAHRITLGWRGDASRDEATLTRAAIELASKIAEAGVRPLEETVFLLDDEVHVLRPIAESPEVVLYLVCDRATTALELARRATRRAEEAFVKSGGARTARVR
ncbi:MAG TPA: hypothetical protein VF407_04170, partial [Polyangiaceae bacterium]